MFNPLIYIIFVSFRVICVNKLFELIACGNVINNYNRFFFVYLFHSVGCCVYFVVFVNLDTIKTKKMNYFREKKLSARLAKL